MHEVRSFPGLESASELSASKSSSRQERLGRRPSLESDVVVHVWKFSASDVRASSRPESEASAPCEKQRRRSPALISMPKQTYRVRRHKYRGKRTGDRSWCRRRTCRMTTHVVRRQCYTTRTKVHPESIISAYYDRADAYFIFGTASSCKRSLVSDWSSDQ